MGEEMDKVVEKVTENTVEKPVFNSEKRYEMSPEKTMLKRLGYIESKIDDELKSSKEVISRLNYTENKTDEQTRILKEILNRLNYIETKIDRMMGNTKRPYSFEDKKEENIYETKTECKVYDESKDSE